LRGRVRNGADNVEIVAPGAVRSTFSTYTGENVDRGVIAARKSTFCARGRALPFSASR